MILYGIIDGGGIIVLVSCFGNVILVVVGISVWLLLVRNGNIGCCCCICKLSRVKSIIVRLVVVDCVWIKRNIIEVFYIYGD